MDNVYKNFSFIVAFMVFVVFFNMALGSKATEGLLWLILLGMALTNINEVSALISSVGTPKPLQKTTSSSGRVHSGVGGSY